MKAMYKFPIILSLYAVVACVGLAFVYNATAPLIAKSAAREIQLALHEIFPDATDFEDVSGKISSGDPVIIFNNAYVAKDANGPLGMVVKVTGPSYASVTLLVGLDMNRKLKPVKFLATSDTPGLGVKAAEDPFRGQFTAKSIDDPFQLKVKGSAGDIDAISGATISSRAVTKIVKVTGSAEEQYLASTFAGTAVSAVQK